MERINRDNYEIYFMDYLDGNLDPCQKDDLMAFLKNNPDLEHELDALKNSPFVEENDVSFKSKDALKKQLTLSHPDYTLFDDLAIGKLEGALTENQVQEFNHLINEFPNKKKEYDLYKKTVMKPDKKLRYNGKSYLKQGKTIQLYRKTLYSYMALAASVLLIVGLYLFLPEAQNIPYNDGISNTPLIAENEFKNNNSFLPSDLDAIKDESDIEFSSIAYNKISSQLMNEVNIPVPEPGSKAMKEEVPEPIQTKYSIRISRKPVYADIVEPDEINTDFQIGNRQFENYDKINRFLTKSLESPIKENQVLRNFSLWELADLGFEGISKLTGKKIFMERRYGEKGNLESLAFQTESFRVSTDLTRIIQE